MKISEEHLVRVLRSVVLLVALVLVIAVLACAVYAVQSVYNRPTCDFNCGGGPHMNF
jgi:hypothetical protein